MNDGIWKVKGHLVLRRGIIPKPVMFLATERIGPDELRKLLHGKDGVHAAGLAKPGDLILPYAEYAIIEVKGGGE